MINWKVIKCVSYSDSKYYGHILSPIDAGLDVIVSIDVWCLSNEVLTRGNVAVLAFLQILLIIVFGLVYDVKDAAQIMKPRLF